VAESGQASRVEAIIDTGFTGYLTLSASQISELGLKEKGAREARLADGQLATFRTFLATILWHQTQRQIMVLQSDAGALIGMALLRGDRLTIDVVPEGVVSIVNAPK